MPRAGLAAISVTEAAAALADEVGVRTAQHGLLAERLGVKAPSLHKHVDCLSDLSHRTAVLAMTELDDAVRDATQGLGRQRNLHRRRTSHASLRERHPGRYAAANAARPGSPDDPIVPASTRLLASLSAVLQGYRLDPDQELHAQRLLRSTLHGYARIEMTGGFQMDADVD